MSIYIQDIKNNGELIVLSDGSKWAVSAFDAFHTKMWRRQDNVQAGTNELINTSRKGEKVPARQVH